MTGQLRILSEALRAFAEATADYDQLLDVIARRLAHVVKDGCVVRLPSDDGWLSAAAIHFPVETYVKDADAVARVREHVAKPHNVAEQLAARRALEKGEALLVPRIDLGQLRAGATPEIASVYETIGIHSLLLVPLRVRGESIGLLSLFRFAPASAPFDDADREMAQALADHGALALTNARLLRSAVRELADRERAEAGIFARRGGPSTSSPSFRPRRWRGRCWRAPSPTPTAGATSSSSCGCSARTTRSLRASPPLRSPRRRNPSNCS